MLSAGDLDRLVTLQRMGETTSGRFGSAKPGEWHDVATVWAKRLPVSDAERVRAAQVGASATDRWQFRWSPELAGLSAADQLVHEGQAFAITALKELGRREAIEVTTVQQVA